MTTQPLPSPEQIDAMAQELRSDFAIDRLKFANMLDVIASHLRTERQAARDGVTNEIVRIALKAYARARGWSQAMVDSTVDNTRADCFVGMRAALESVALPAEVPPDATQAMCDSVRYLLVGMEQNGRTFGSIRQHCQWSGMDVDNWPHWTINRDTEHFNKSACAALIWWLMYQEAMLSASPKAQKAGEEG